MNALVEALLRWLVDYYLLATLLLGASLFASWLIVQPARRVALARAALAGLALLALLCALPGWSVVHLMTREASAPATAVSLPPPDTEIVAAEAMPIEAPDEPTWPPQTPDVPSAPVETQTAAPLSSAIRVADVVAVAYLCGMFLIVAWQLLGHWRARALVNRAMPASAELQRMLMKVGVAGVEPAGEPPARRRWGLRFATTPATLSRNLPPRLLISPNLSTAVALGIFRPMILLPQRLIESTDLTALRTILAHELAHIRHGDLRLLALCRALFVLLWANPLFWLLRRRLRLDQETLADAAAAEVTTRHQYAEQLVDWAKRFATDRPPALAAAVGLWESPSQLRYRIAVLLDERLTIWRECSRRWRLASLAVCAGVAVGLSLVTLEPAVSEPANQNAPNPAKPQALANEAEQRIDLPIVVAKHVVLLNGKMITSWPGLEDFIAAMPDPALVYPRFYVTRGAREAGLDVLTNLEIQRLRERFNLKGHSEGSLWPRADLRYDRIEDESDLVPDESLRVEGRVVDRDGKPVANAEVILITPVDESISYKTLDIALVEGHVRNRLEEVITDSGSDGQFAIYPPKDAKYYVVAMHPTAGFNLARGQQFVEAGEVKLFPWAALVSELGEEPGMNLNQSASIQTRLAAEDGYTEIVFSQYWSDLKNKEPTKVFTFGHIPPIFETTIDRSFADAEGTSIGLPGASVGLLPGETRRLDLGPLSEKQREHLKQLRDDLRQRREESRKREENRNADSDAPISTQQASNLAVGEPQPNTITVQNDHEKIGNHFILCRVTTDLQRSLLGDVSKPAADASLCVFVNGMTFTDEQMDVASPEFVSLADRLDELANEDNRQVFFKIQSAVSRNDAFETIRDRAVSLSELCELLGRGAGYKSVRSTQAYKGSDSNWKAFVAKADAAAVSAKSAVEDSIGNDRIQVFPVRTFLSRLLVDADCVVNIVPVLRHTEGNRFPEDFLAEMQQFVPQLTYEKQQTLMFEVHHVESAKEHLEAWVKDRVALKEFAEQFGFESCQVEQSLTGEPEETTKPAATDAATAKPQANTITGRCVDEQGRPVAGAKLWLVLRLGIDQLDGWLVRGESNQDGTFKLEAPAKWTTPGNFWPDNTLWCYSADHELASKSAYPQLHRGTNDPIEIVLSPATDTAFVITSPDGKPLEGAMVEPWHYLAGSGYNVAPSELRQALSKRSNKEGRALLPNLGREELKSINIIASEYGTQRKELDHTAKSAAERPVRLQTTGSLQGRLIASDRQAVANRRITVEGRDERREGREDGTNTRGVALTTTDEDGAFTIESIAPGLVDTYLEKDRSSEFLPRIPERIEVIANQETGVEIPLERSVVVKGLIRTDKEHKPIPGVLISVRTIHGRQVTGEVVRSDSEGRFTARVLAGIVDQGVIVRPREYDNWIQPERSQTDRVEVSSSETVVDLPPIDLVRTIEVKGLLLDEKGSPIPNVRLSAITGNRVYSGAYTDSEGKFTLRRPEDIEIDKYEVHLGQNRPVQYASIEQKEPLLLRLEAHHAE